MRPLKLSTLAVLGVLAGSSLAFAQTPDTPTTAPASPAGSPTDKTSISKSCSEQADQRKLHGKKRKTFRAQCKKAGGNPPA